MRASPPSPLLGFVADLVDAVGGPFAPGLYPCTPTPVVSFRFEAGFFTSFGTPYLWEEVTAFFNPSSLLLSIHKGL